MSGLVCKSGRLVHKFAGSGLKIGAARIGFADVGSLREDGPRIRVRGDR